MDLKKKKQFIMRQHFSKVERKAAEMSLFEKCVIQIDSNF